MPRLRHEELLPIEPWFLQATSGYQADGRTLANRAKDEASNFRDLFRAPSPVKVCMNPSVPTIMLITQAQEIVNRLAMYVQAYTLYSSVRPFGCSTIVGGVDNTGPQLFIVEPSGVAYVRHLPDYHVSY